MNRTSKKNKERRKRRAQERKKKKKGKTDWLDWVRIFRVTARHPYGSFQWVRFILRLPLAVARSKISIRDPVSAYDDDSAARCVDPYRAARRAPRKNDIHLTGLFNLEPLVRELGN